MVPAQSPDVGAADANFLPLQDIGSALTPMAAVQIVALFPSGHDSEDEMSNTLLKKRDLVLDARLTWEAMPPTDHAHHFKPLIPVASGSVL
jgi:hypothetical protein